MPDFRVELHPVAPATITKVVWNDPPTVMHPSRITRDGDRQYCRNNMHVGDQLDIHAIIDGESAALSDAFVGEFQMYPVERPNVGGSIPRVFPFPNVSSIQRFTFPYYGHYTFVVRHLDTNNGPYSRNGGAILIHLEVLP